MPSLLALVSLLCCSSPTAARHELPPVLEATANPNHTPAGTLRDGVLRVSLYAARGRWHPLADDGPTLEAELFGEEGKAPTDPGPLVRVPLGARVEIRLRNALTDTLRLSWRCLKKCGANDTLRVAPGATGTLVTTPAFSGTFAYYGSPVRKGKLDDGGDHAQLVGAIVVQPASEKLEPVLGTTVWVAPDSAKGERVAFFINGKSWPYTERFTYTVGDSVRWRLVTLGGDEHPMHLHGFYFRVLERSDGDTNRVIPAAQQSLAVTEEVGALAGAVIAWSPDRPGNWLLHCHKAFHTSFERNDDIADRPYPPPGHHGGANHATDGMGGLVVGITVKPAPTATLASAPRIDARMRLLVHRREHFWGKEAALGYVLQRGDSVPARDSVVVPGPILTLVRGERTAITVVNETDQHTAVHWHGIELESYYDGVAGWSGTTPQIAPLIAPGDSFVALMTPPRAGTFIYHTHVDDMRQLGAGLYGPLVVLEPGQKWNDSTDHVFMLAQGGYDTPAWLVVNGAPAARPVEWKAGVAHRLRFISLTIDHEARVTIERPDGKPVVWRQVAKDGAALTAAQPEQAAKLRIGPGETYDFELVPASGRYLIRFESFTDVLLRIDVP